VTGAKEVAAITHEDFVKAYRSRQVAAAVDYRLSLRLMETKAVRKEYRAAHLFWTWVWFLSIPAAIGLAVWVTWWVGLLVFLIGCALPRAIRKSATAFVLEQALEDEGFYNSALECGALRIDART
jgi:hypothetical protein